MICRSAVVFIVVIRWYLLYGMSTVTFIYNNRLTLCEWYY